MPNCSICSDWARRDLVNAALTGGDSPAEILKRYGPSVVGSQSALYRHARHFSKSSLISNRWASNDTSTGEVIADLGALRRSLLDDYAAARAASGSSIAASRAAREATNVSATLLREVGFDDDETTRTLGHHAELQRILQRAALNRPGLALDLAEAAEGLRFASWPEEFRGLEATAAQHREGIKK